MFSWIFRGALAATICGATVLMAAERGRYVRVAPPHARAGQTGASTHEAEPFELLPATAALGRDVQDASGESAGRIQELIADASRRRIAFVLLDAEFLGAQGKVLPVPWMALTRSDRSDADRDDDAFKLALDRERIRDAKSYDLIDLPDLVQERRARELYAYYGQKPYWDSTLLLRGEPVSPDRRGRRPQPAHSRPLMLKLNVDMVGHLVQHASNGETLGELSDLLIDRQTGEMAFGSVQLHRGTSVMHTDPGKNLVILPIEMFSFNRYGDPNAPYVIECCLEKLKSHRIRAEDAPDLKSRAWARRLYADFGRRPYWEK